MKKALCAALAVLLAALTACSGTRENAADENSAAPAVSSAAESSDASSEESGVPEEKPAFVPPELHPNHSAVAVYCVDDDELLYGENIDERLAPASLTKLMTCAVTLRYANVNEVFEAGSEQDLVDPESSIAYILPGHRLCVYDLIGGMLLPSGNDAAYCAAVNVARKVGGNELDDISAVEFFCALMNDLAAKLGMENTHFADPDGWDNDDHYTTVSDLIRLSKYAMTLPVIREIAALPEMFVTYDSGETNEWHNSNPLVNPESGFYSRHATGLKTGATDNAGRCLIATFIKNKKSYIIITMGYESIEERCLDTMALFAGIT